MPNLATFSDFVSATNERVITPPKKIINDVALRTFVLGDMLKGKGENQVVKSGSKLTDRIQLTAGSAFGFYEPNDAMSANLEQSLSKIEVPWRFAKTYWGWTDQEVELNEGDRLVQWKDIRDTKRQQAFVDMFVGMEAQLWATADQPSMEGTGGGGRPYSIRAFVTEDGLSPWSGTLMTVDPTVKTAWKNQVFNYAAASIDTTLQPSFENAWVSLNFQSPDNSTSYFTETKFNKFKIYTNKDGRTKYASLTRNANDRAMIGSKPDLGFAVEDLTYAGIPVKYIEQLDNVGYATGQPRFFWLNFEFLCPIFHSTRYMYEKEPMNGGIIQPYTTIVFKDTWYNLFCRSRRRLGIVVPV